MKAGILARLWHVCLQMFSSSRHRGFGGRKGGHVICGYNYYIISPYHMGPPNPKWWMGRSLRISLYPYAFAEPNVNILPNISSGPKDNYNTPEERAGRSFSFFIMVLTRFLIGSYKMYI